jgi:alpha-methylacyl-CoA racemase
MGPLAGFRIIEMAGIGPAPFAAALLADMGAEVIRVDRREAADLGLPGREPKFDVLHRGRRSLALDIKTEAGRAVVCKLATKADALIEGFRPGVMERLGLGPDELLALNPRLVFGRMTGFGQDGPLAQAAGHDINYIALAGALHAIGRKGEAPVPPLNLVGDFGGGGMFLAFGVLCGLLETQKSGKGQVVDAAMVDGAAYLLAGIYGLYSQGSWADERGVNFVDSGAPWYDVYKTKDGKWLSVGAIEKRFYEELVEKLGLASAGLPKQHDRKGWPLLKERFAAAIASKTRDEWERIFEGSDACVAPVLALGEVEKHPHNAARRTFVRRDGVLQPGPAPRFSRTKSEMGPAPRGRGADSEAILKDWGFASAEIAQLSKTGVIGAAKAER